LGCRKEEKVDPSKIDEMSEKVKEKAILKRTLSIH